jgi:hypothetical protein
MKTINIITGIAGLVLTILGLALMYAQCPIGIVATGAGIGIMLITQVKIDGEYYHGK